MTEPSAASLDSLACEFFREFARCEYCLKAVGLREDSPDAKANWPLFGTAVEALFEKPNSTDLEAAIHYLLENPPRKQVIRDGQLEWDARLPDHGSQAELILRLVCRIRNNVFHGGKFNGRWFEPQRSHNLIRHAVTILRACIAFHPDVSSAYAERAD